MANKTVESLTEQTSPKSGDSLYLVRNGSDFKVDFKNVGSSVLSDTYSNVSTLKTNTNLSEGKLYFLSDKNIYLRAVSGGAFNNIGLLKATNADYQTHSQWVSNSDGGSYTSGNKAIYNNKVFENTTGTNTDTAPPSDGTNWTEVSVNDADYNTEYDTVYYDFDNDEVLFREDKRGNKVGGSLSYIQSNDPIGHFQWGNDTVNDNYVINSRIKDCLNQRGSVENNHVFGQSAIEASDNSSSINDNSVYSQSTLKANENAGGVTRCFVQGNSTADFDNNSGSKDENVVMQQSSLTSTGTGSGFSNNTVTERSSCTVNTNASAFSRNTVRAGVTVSIINNSVIQGLTFADDLSNYTNDTSLSSTYIYELGRSTVEESYNISKTITGFPNTDDIVISGDETTIYESGDSIKINGSSTNDGTYTISSVSYAAGSDETTITVSGGGLTSESAAGTVTGVQIDYSGLEIAGVLEIQSAVNFKLEKVNNAPTNFPFKIFPQNGITITAVHAAVASVASDEITLTGGVDLSLVGRPVGVEDSDFLILESQGSWNREVYNSILS